MFDDLKIRNKLILLMAGPVVIILLLSALGARDRRASASESREVEKLVIVASSNSDVVDALQQESIYSASYLGSNRKSWEEELATARANTDAVLERALPRLSSLNQTSNLRSSAQLAAGAADKLGYYRDSVDQGLRTGQVHQMVVNYADMQGTFLAVNTNIAAAITDPRSAAELRSANALSSYKAALATQGALISGAAATEGFGSDAAFGAYKDAKNAERDALALMNSLSGTDRKGAIRDAMASDQAAIFDLVRQRADKAGADGTLEADAKAVTEAASAVVSGLHEVEFAQYRTLVASAQAAASSAERASSLFLLAAVVALGSAAIAALFLGRRITVPLRRLTEAADRLSGEQMPQLIETLKSPTDDALGAHIGAMKPIDIDSDDEIGRLARSFNEVQRVAGQVAAEQAHLLRKGIGEMFVNLARRNQALLDRQIEFIDELERGEEDPDQLDNLYRLDHLATRMRRNAESLLVLAGAEPPRRRGRPAPLANVVRAALAEVEDFGRIELLSFDEVLVASNAAADLAHLLSELMENATNFSPPDTRVEVVGHKTKADGYVISVTDHGIGMSPDQIGEANESLARPPLVGLTMSRSLGFIVVGRLAARHGIAVRMMPSAAGGVTAVVSIPPSLVVDTPGGMEPEPAFEPPARLKQVFESSGSSAPAETDSPMADAAPLLELPNANGGPSLPAPAVFAPPAGEVPAPTEPQAPAEATPPPAVFAPPAGEAPMPSRKPAPTSEPVAWPAEEAPAAADGLPTRSIFDAPASPGSEVDTAAIAAEVDAAVAPAMPAAMSFAAPTAPVDPAAPVPPSVQPSAERIDAPAGPPAGSRPFFLEDAAPPRPFGLPASDAPAAPAAPPEVPSPPRLFGGPAKPASTPAAPVDVPAPAAEAPAPPAPAPAPEAPAPAPVAEAPLVEAPAAPTPAAPAAAPLATRTPRTHSDGPPPPAPAAPTAPARPSAAAPAVTVPRIPGRPTPDAAPAPVAGAAPAAPASTAPAAAPAAPATTTSGLAQRVPRAAGAQRAIPGSEVERGVSGSRRSPEEIRKMLSQHSAGRQRARVQEQPVTAGAPEEMETT